MVYPSPSPLFTQALRYPHELVVRVRVFRSGSDITPSGYNQWGGGLPITDGGTVTIDVSSQVRRQLSITVADPALSPQIAQDLLAPFGTELAVATGIKYPNGKVDWVPLGRFRVDSATATQSGQSGPTGVDVAGSDRSANIVDGRFFIPTKSVGSTVVAEIRHLVDPVMPAGVPSMVDLSGNTAACPAQVYDDKDRAGAVARLAASINTEFFISPDGTPTLRTLKKPSDPAAWTIDVGAQGVLLEASPAVDRTNIYNGVIATGERTDGTPAGFAVVTDDDPSSPTMWGGPFGKKPVFFSSPTLAPAQCFGAAAGLLARHTGAGWTISLSSLTNPLLEGGDPIQVNLPDGRIQRHIVDKLTIPLDVSTAMAIETHSNDPAGDQSGGP